MEAGASYYHYQAQPGNEKQAQPGYEKSDRLVVGSPFNFFQTNFPGMLSFLATVRGLFQILHIA